jgi:hypothetical protein
VNVSQTILACAMTLAFSQAALAEIYKSKDAEGNTVFTDKPATQEAKPVELAPTNIAEPPEEMPEPVEAPAAAPAPQAPAPAEGGDVVIIGGNDELDERVERRIIERRRDEIPTAEPLHEGGDKENMSATHRNVPDPAARPTPQHRSPGGR